MKLIIFIIVININKVISTLTTTLQFFMVDFWLDIKKPTNNILNPEFKSMVPKSLYPIAQIYYDPCSS